jgi:hypothetical protein
MKRFLVAFLVCTAMLLAQTQAQAASKITVIVASSVDTSEQNYMNVTYKKLVELAQKYSDNAFDFHLATNRKPSAPSSSARFRCPCSPRTTMRPLPRPAAG